MAAQPLLWAPPPRQVAAAVLTHALPARGTAILARCSHLDRLADAEIAEQLRQPIGQLGVLVIPREAEEEAIRRALEKASTENKVRDAIQRGMSTVDAFRTFGVM